MMVDVADDLDRVGAGLHEHVDATDAGRWTLRGQFTQRHTLTVGAVAGALSLLVALWIDSHVGQRISPRAVTTATVAGAVLAMLWEAVAELDGARRSYIRRLVAFGTVLFASVLVIYLLAQRSRVGQRFERDVLLGRTSGRLEPTAQTLLSQLTLGAVLFFGVGTSLVAAARRRVRLGEATGIAILLAAGSAAILKRWLLPRPRLLGDQAVATVTSYPSGHVTAAAALAAALVVVVGHRWRRRAAVAGGGLVALVGVAVLVTGWHRPSDAIGGLLLGVAWIAVAAAVSTRREPVSGPLGARAVAITARTWKATGYLGGGAFVLLVVVEISRLAGLVGRPPHTLAFLAGSFAFLAVDILVYATLAALIDDGPEWPVADGPSPTTDP